VTGEARPSALDDAEPDARNVVELLDGLPGAYERARIGLEQAATGETVSLDELSAGLT
jgi:hypothetical protein